MAKLRQVVLEVERKFCGLAVPNLNTTAGTPAFRNLHFLGQRSFKDTYFDKHEKLSSRGLWVRKRQFAGSDPVWEAKCREGGNFTNSMFEEVTDLTAIAGRVANITGRDESAATNFGLSPMAALVTQRKSWLADGEFKIVLDRMDFGHEVGEVELEQTLILPRGQGTLDDVEARKRSMTQDMDDRIEAFMKRYHWAFRPGVPRGKLTAFFDRERELARV